MSSLNIIAPPRPSLDPEVLIELPDPNPISDTCTLIMNGHHNYGMERGPREDDTEEETEPFLDNTKSNRSSSSRKSESSNSAASTLVSSTVFQRKESPAPSSADDDSEADAEPESSTHLLQNSEQAQSPKCLRTKLPNFISSPSKKQTDTHSHIHHRPLGMPQSTLPPHAFPAKWNRTVSQFICLGLAMFFVFVVVFSGVGLYLNRPGACIPIRQWWQSTVMYEIFPASFQDSDGDGFGDMKGILERLDYVQNLSIDVIRLNSIFSALDYPLEYEHVIDFSNVDPHLGKMEDFESLVKEIHARGMYVVLDMNPTMTSDQHTWAAHWLLHREGRYENYYVNISDNKVEPPLEPNSEHPDPNWKPPHRTFGSHLFLNWSNPQLQQEMKDVMDMWLSLGVDGFYMKHLENLHVAHQDHVTTIVHQWRSLLDKHSVNSTRKILVVSQDTLEHLSLPSIIDLVDSRVDLSSNGSALNPGEEVARVFRVWGQYPGSPEILWHVASVETMRLAGRMNEGCNLAAVLLLDMLPGSISSFYGDEIGLQDSVDPLTSKVYRGGQLAPMQWTSGPQSNFTSNDTIPWISIHPSYTTSNAETQSEKLRVFKKIIELKKESFVLSAAKGRSLIYDFGGGTTAQKDENSPQWYSNRCGLVSVRDMDRVFVGNFGTEPQIISEDVCLGEGVFIGSEHELKIILSTNPSLQGKAELGRLILEPGNAVVGLLIT